MRNPGLGREEFEAALKEYLGVTNVLWLAGGVVGDDTHGHIDDICRFVNPTTRGADPRRRIRKDINYRPLAENWERIQDLRLEDGSQAGGGGAAHARRRSTSTATGCRPATPTSTSPTRR